MFALALYAAAGLLTLAYMAWRIVWREGRENSALIHVVAPLLEQFKNIWGPFTTYLLITTFVLATPIGFAVIWPLALLVELMVIGRKADMKKEESSGVKSSEETARQELAILVPQRKILNDAIAEREQTLAKIAATRDRFVYDGGDGSSIEKAVIVRGAQSEEEIGTALYDYIGRVFGPGSVRHPVAQRTRAGERSYGRIAFELPSGEHVTVYFDITEPTEAIRDRVGQ